MIIQLMRVGVIVLSLCLSGCAYQQLSKVANAMDDAPVGGAYDISVSQRNSHFVLEGEVASEGDREIMEAAARSAAGSLPIRNDLLVNRDLSAAQQRRMRAVASKGTQPDKRWIAKIIEDYDEDFEWSLRQNTVVVKGNAENHREVDELLANLLMVPGVDDVESTIEIKSRRYMWRWKDKYKS